MARQRYDYPDDLFESTRMSIGDHIDELRTRLIRCLLILFVVMFGAVAVDSIADGMGWKDVGVGKLALRIITEPIETQVRDFYARRNEEAWKRFLDQSPNADPNQLEELRTRVLRGDGVSSLSEKERLLLASRGEVIKVKVPIKTFTDHFDIKPRDPNLKEIEVPMEVPPAAIHNINNRGETLLGSKQYLTSLSVQEPLVVYFKVTLIVSTIIASPLLFYQFWAFVGAGLYPHEKGYVYWLLGFSIPLFLAGVVLCQIFVIPGAIKALIGFNNWIGLDPDLRLNEWLGFALILPVVFGLSFQTPLLMLFFTRIGTFTAEDYLSKWRYAVMILAVFAAVLTPTPDPFTMMYLFLPTFTLYLLGIGLCKLWPYVPFDADYEVPASEEVAV